MRRRGPKAADRVARAGAALVAGVGAALGAQPATAGPSGAAVRGGAVAISTDGATTTIVQSTPRALIEWDSFDIDAGETVRFAQPGRDSVALNRVTGPGATDIRGRLQANGNVWIVNRHGVTIHQGARIDVGGLLATTADIADDAFMRGDDRFDRPGAPGASVVNEGEISFGDAGLVGLVAPDAANHGVISGRLGEVLVGGARTLAVDFAGDGLIAFPLDAGGAAALRASNAGTILNDGGRIRVSAAQAAALVDGVAALDGLARADSIGAVAGVVEVSAPGGAVSVTGRALARGGAGEAGGSAAMTGARVVVAEGAVIDVSGGSRGGRADIVGTESLGFFGLARASASAGPGGFVDTSAANLTVAGPVEVGAGGLWLIDPTNIVIGPTIGTDGVNVAAGNIVSALAAGSDVTVSTAGAGFLLVEGADPALVADGGLDPEESGTLSVIGGLTGIEMSATPATLTLVADGPLTLEDGISQTAAGGALSLSLIGDDAVAVQSGAAIDIRGAFDMAAGGGAVFSPLISAGSIDLTSVGDMSVLGLMLAAGDLLVRSSAGALTVSAAAMEAGGDFELGAVGPIEVISALSAIAGSDLTIETDGDITISGGAMSVGGAAAMTAGGALSMGAALGAVSVEVEAAFVSVSAAMDAVGDIALLSLTDGMVVSGSGLDAGGDLALTAGGTLAVSAGTLQAGNDLDLVATGALTLSGDELSAGGAATMSAGGEASIGAALSAGSIDVESSGAMAVGAEMDAVGDLALRSLTAGVAVSGPGLVAGGDLGLSAAGSLSASATTIEAGADLDLIAAGALSLSGDAISAGGSATMSAGGEASIGAALSAGSIDVESSGAMAVGAEMDAVGDLALRSLTAGVAVSGPGLFAGGDLGVSAAGSLSASASALEAGADLDLVAAGALTLSGDAISAGGAATFEATNIQSVDDQILQADIALSLDDVTLRQVGDGDVALVDNLLGGVDANTLNLARFEAAGPVTLAVETEAGAITADGIDATDAGGLTLALRPTGAMRFIGDASTLGTVTVGSGTPATTGTTALSFEAGVSATGFTAVAQGDVTQTAAVTLGTFDVLTAGDLALDLAANGFGTVTGAAASAALRDADGFLVDGLEAGATELTAVTGDLTLRALAAGDLTAAAGGRLRFEGVSATSLSASAQSIVDPSGAGDAAFGDAAIEVSGDAGFSAVGDLSLANATGAGLGVHLFGGRVDIAAEQASLRALSAVRLGAVDVSSAVDLDPTIADGVALRVRADGIEDTAGFRVNAVGAVALTATADGSDPAGIGAALTNGRDIVLDNAGADALAATSVTLVGEDVFARLAGDVALGAVSAADTENDCRFDADAANFSAFERSFNLTVHAGRITDTPGLRVEAGGDARFVAAIGGGEVADGAPATLTNGRDIVLDNAGEDDALRVVGLSLAGEDALIQSDRAVTLRRITLADTANDALSGLDAPDGTGPSLILRAGTITDAAEATQTGAGAEFRASAGGAAPTAANGRDIALTNGLHGFGGAVSLSGEDVFLSSAGALALGDVTARASANDATLDAVRAGAPGGDRVLTLRAGGAVSQAPGAALVADGFADVAAMVGATPFDVTLGNAGNDVRTFSALGAAILFADGSTGGDALAPDLTVTDTRAAASLTVVSAGALSVTRAQVEDAGGARGALTADAATTLAARDLTADALTLRTGAGAADPSAASALTLEGFTADTLTVRVAETGAGRGRALTLARGALAGAVDLSDPLRPLTALTVTETTSSGTGAVSLAVSSGADPDGVADSLSVDRLRHAGALSLAGRAVEIGRLAAPSLSVAARATGVAAPAEVARLPDAGLASAPGETDVAGVALAAPGAPTNFRTALIAETLPSAPFPDLLAVAGETRIVSDGAIRLRGRVDAAGDPLRNAFGGVVHLSAAGDVALEAAGALALGDVSAARLALRANAADATGGAAGVSQAPGSAVVARNGATFVTGAQAGGFDPTTTADVVLTEAGNAFGGPVSLIARDAALSGGGALTLFDTRLAADLALESLSGGLVLRDVAVGGEVALRAAGTLDLARVSAASLNARSGGAASAQDLATTGRAVITAGGALTARDLALGGASLSGTVATVERARTGAAGLTLRATVGALSADAVATTGALTLDAATDARLGALKAGGLSVRAGRDALAGLGAAASTGVGARAAASAPATDPARDTGDPADARALLALGPLAAVGGSTAAAPGFDRLIETAGAASFAVGRDLAATREPGGAARHNAFGGPVSLTGGGPGDGPEGLLVIESAGALTLGASALNGASLLARAGADGAPEAAIGQSGALDMGATPGSATFLVGDPATPGGVVSPEALTGSVTLDRGANRFGRVSLAAGSARLASDHGYDVAGARLAGDLEARSGGALAVRDASVGGAALLEGGLGATVERLTVAGALTARGGGPVALTDVSAASATALSAGGLRLGGVAVPGAVDIRETADGNVTLAGLRVGGALTLTIEGAGAVAGAAPEAGPAARGAAAATLGAVAANGRRVAFRFDAAADAAGARLGSVRAEGPTRAQVAAPGGVSLAGVGAGARADGTGGFAGPDANLFAGGLTLSGVGGTAALEHAGDLAISIIGPAPGLNLTLIPDGDLRLEGVTGSPAARLGTVAIIGADSALLDADTDGDVLFARVLVARDIPGALSNGLSFEQVTELDLAQAFVGVNLSDGFSYSDVGVIALTGSIRGNNTRAAGLFPSGGPTGAARTFNNCLIGDLASCGSTPAALNFTLSTRTPALLFDLTLTDLADVYTSFGNEELWVAPAAFATDLSEEDAAAGDPEDGP